MKKKAMGLILGVAVLVAAVTTITVVEKNNKDAVIFPPSSPTAVIFPPTELPSSTQG